MIELAHRNWLRIMKCLGCKRESPPGMTASPEDTEDLLYFYGNLSGWMFIGIPQALLSKRSTI